MAVRYGRGDVKQTTTGFRDPRHHICRKQIPIPETQDTTSAESKFLSLDQLLPLGNQTDLSEWYATL